MNSTFHHKGENPTDDVLRKFAYAEEFEARQRRGVWIYAGAFALFAVIIASVAMLFVGRGFIRVLWIFPAFGALASLQWLGLWTKGSPLCPACHQDITVCAMSHCHSCGDVLKQGRCEGCGVDESFVAALASSAPGNDGTINYCPACGVLLNTNFQRGERHYNPLTD